jgi:tRNA modification GTPase
MHDLGTTLVAVATPPGRGGVGCLRLSGPASAAIGRRIFRPARGDGAQHRPIRFGRFVTREGRPVDHGYLVLFPPAASFTGEATAELWAHGSPAVLAELVLAAIDAGAVPAGPGEFTYRALRHGRLDLSRAEAVRDLVEARTLYQARIAFSQAEGALSRVLAPLREELASWIARGEAAIEFVEESETALSRETLTRAIAGASARCAMLLAGFHAGRLVRDGAKLAIVGMPNAGKSSLFNRLLARDRAIVTPVPGTTRDTLEETLDLEGIPVLLVDTAGLRDSVDPVESEGVLRAQRAREEADLVLLVLDGSRPLAPLEWESLDRARHEPAAARTVVVVNKADLPLVAALPAVPAVLSVSALDGTGVDALRAELRARLVGRGPLEDPVLTNARHARAIESARTALARAEHGAHSGFPEELLLEDLREALQHLAEITGEFTNEQLYDRIFSTFCIGK